MSGTRRILETDVLTPPPDVTTSRLVDAALEEDLAAAGDITTNAVVPSDVGAEAFLVARDAGVAAGLFMAERVFGRLDPTLVVERLVEEGATVAPGDRLAHASGPARALLTGERTALNFVGHLSGIATLVARYRQACDPHGAEVVATRKTTPGLRALEKHAVRAGGGGAHRYGLYDAILIKDNHIALAGGVEEAVRRARVSVDHLVGLQVEVDTLEQLESLLPLDVDAVLLDNMSNDELRRAVEMCRGRLLTEASGGVTLETIAEIASTGVDRISVGALTHSAPSLDVALDVEL